MAISENLFSQEDGKREPIAIEMKIPGSDQAIAKGDIFFEKAESIEAVSTKNGYYFKCYCYMNGNREFVAQLQEDLHLISADKACKDFEGRLYKDYGFESRTGMITLSLTRSCSSVAFKNRTNGR